jgi:hypothetical protein
MRCSYRRPHEVLFVVQTNSNRIAVEAWISKTPFLTSSRVTSPSGNPESVSKDCPAQVLVVAQHAIKRKAYRQ